MLLQTNSYIVPKDKRTEHARLILRFKQTLARLGCDHFEAYEQVGANWSPTEATGRFVQIMRFRDRKHQQQVQAAERSDAGAQALIKEFCELINFPYQQQQGLFAVGFYTSILPGATARVAPPPPPSAPFSRAESGAIGVPSHPPTPPPPHEHEEPPTPPTMAQEGDEGTPADLLSRGDAASANGGEPNGELDIDDLLREPANRPKDREEQKEPASPPDRAMQYEP